MPTEPAQKNDISILSTWYVSAGIFMLFYTSAVYLLDRMLSHRVPLLRN